MSLSPTVDAWVCSAADRGASLQVVESHCRARPPDVHGPIIHDVDGRFVVIRVDERALPPGAPENVYLVQGRGLFLEAKRVEWLNRGQPRALLSLTAL